MALPPSARRVERSRALFGALDAFLLRDLLRLVEAYDRWPGQRFRRKETKGVNVDEGKTRIYNPEVDRLVGVLGENSFANGACRWTITLPFGRLAWIGIARYDAMRFHYDYEREDVAFLLVERTLRFFPFKLNDVQDIEFAKPIASAPTMSFSFDADLEKRELRVALNGVPAVQPLFTDLPDIANMTIYACLDGRMIMEAAEWLLLESPDE